LSRHLRAFEEIGGATARHDGGGSVGDDDVAAWPLLAAQNRANQFGITRRVSAGTFIASSVEARTRPSEVRPWRTWNRRTASST